MSAFSQKFQKKNSGTNPTNATKPKTKPTGWEDDDDEPAPPLKQEPIREFKPVTHTLPSVSIISQPKTEKPGDEDLNLCLSKRIIFNSEFELLSGEELATKNIEYEMKLVEDIIQPQGAKIKPVDDVLIEFSKACESLPVQLMGSLILASLHYEISWKSFIKCFYVIEHLCKKLPNYARYFKYHRNLIENLEFQAEPAQVKQISAAHQLVLDCLRDQLTPKNLANSGKADPLYEKFREQENLNSKGNKSNLLEDSDPESQNRLQPKKDKPSSNFSFIGGQKENSKAQQSSVNNNNNLLNMMSSTNNNALNQPQNNIFSSNVSNKPNYQPQPQPQPQPQKSAISIDPQLASIDFSAPIKEQPKTVPLTFIPQSQPKLPNTNYNILDSIQQPLYNSGFNPNPYSRPLGYQTSFQSQNVAMGFNSSNMNNMNNPPAMVKKDSLKATKNGNNDKESAFDFVNDLVKLK